MRIRIETKLQHYHKRPSYKLTFQKDFQTFYIHEYLEDRSFLPKSFLIFEVVSWDFTPKFSYDVIIQKGLLSMN